MISASAAYCTLVSGGSGSRSGANWPTAWADFPVRNRFHRPRLSASALRSAVTGTRSHCLLIATAASTCSAYTASAG